MKSKPIILAARGEVVFPPPVWLMRQAGRYLPEYHVTKEKAGGFLGLCKIPEHGVEVTLQPLRRFKLDAAILFSDILIPAQAMGIELDFAPGPIIGNPVRSDADVAALQVPEPEEKLGFVLEILRILKKELPEPMALIGFAGSPFTVASYMVEGAGPARGFETIRRMMYERPDLLSKLLDKVTATTIAYLRAQIKAGAEVVQLFDSSAGQLTPPTYRAFALPYASKVLDGIADLDVPAIYFAPGAMSSLKEMATLNCQVIGVDHHIELSAARAILGPRMAVQGNLDPAVLLGSPAAVKANVQQVLRENRGRPGHIFNLGHGVLPATRIENIEVLLAALREESSPPQ